jgi:transcriptional regulator with XRE-family HTH domain
MSKEKSTTRPKKSVGQVAENIKKYRKLAGISQDQLSKKADLAFHTIAKIEAGSTPNPTIETVAKIAKALDVSVDDLLNKSKACLPVRSRTAKAG